MIVVPVKTFNVFKQFLFLQAANKGIYMSEYLRQLIDEFITRDDKPVIMFRDYDILVDGIAASRSMITFKLPENLAARLNEFVHKHSVTRSEAVNSAIYYKYRELNKDVKLLRRRNITYINILLLLLKESGKNMSYYAEKIGMKYGMNITHYIKTLEENGLVRVERSRKNTGVVYLTECGEELVKKMIESDVISFELVNCNNFGGDE